MRYSDPAQRASYENDPPRDIEDELCNGLIDAGVVKPCADDHALGATLPPSMMNGASLMARLEQEVQEDEDARAAVEASGADPGLTLFDCVDADDADDTVDSGLPTMFPPPLEDRLPRLLQIVCRAFQDVRGYWSTDRVIADPELGDLFLRRCWELGAQASAYELNWTLLHGRKNRVFSGLRRSRRFVLPRATVDQFCFASEMAARCIQDTQAKAYGRIVSLDKIFCDPTLATEFDSLAARLAPNHSVLQYRWAALSLRKARRHSLSTVKLRHGDFEDLGYTRELSLQDIPKARGVYYFAQEGRMLFCGQTESLRRQVEIHFDCVGTRVIPSWMDDRRLDAMRLLVAPVAGVSARQRESLKAGQVALHRPRFNWVPECHVA